MTDFPQPYWSEWADKIISKYSLREGPKGEHHGACPSCGHNDWPSTRFWISEHNGLVKVFCRQCNDFKAITDEMAHDGVWPVKQKQYEYRPKPSINDFANVVQLDTSPNATDYIQRKGIKLIGASMEGDTVVVPLYNYEGKVVGEQRIQPCGSKKFNAGLKKDDAFGVIGQLQPGQVWVTEGYATGVSVHMATGLPVVWALDAGTLPKVCDKINFTWPDIELKIAGDNDKPGIAAAHAAKQPYSLPPTADMDWNDVHVTSGLDAVRDGLERLHEAHREPERPALFTHIDELKIRKPEWLIENLLEQDTLAMCFGASGSGKTFLVLDMALCVATGRSWNGYYAKKKPVFYLAGEGGNGLARRVAAWKKHNGVGPGEAEFYKSNRAVVLSDPAQVTHMVEQIDLMIEAKGVPGLLIVDTLARSLGASEESSGTDMNLLIGELDGLRERYKDMVVLLVHHTGHTNKERGRGASNITAALDHEFRVETWGEDELAKVLVTWTKMKEDAFPPQMAFSKLPVQLMTPEAEEVTSIVLERTEDLPESKAGGGMSATQKTVLKAFDELAEHGEVMREELKAHYFDGHGTGSENADRKRFNANLKKLIERQILVQKEGVLSRV